MKYLNYVGVFAAGILVHWWWSTYFSFFGLAPHVLLVLTVAVALRSGPVVSQSFAFAWGLCLDVLGAHLFGANALVLTLVAYLVGMARRQMDVSNALSQSMVTGFVTLSYFPCLALLGLLFKGETFWVGWRMFCFGPLLNGAAAPFGFLIVQRYLQP